jgi:hypothetical protein
MFRILWITLFVLSFSLRADASPAFEKLELSQTAGPAPLTVQITAPVNQSMSVNWGDGVEVSGEDEARFKHVYKVPGTFVVKAEISHPGPSDQPVVDWSDKAVVTVSGTSGVQNKPVLILNSPKGGEKFLYEEYPQAEVSVFPQMSSSLTIDWVDEDGGLISRHVSQVANEGTVRWDAGGDSNIKQYNHDLIEGKNKFKIKVTLTAGGQTIASAESGWFLMIGEEKGEMLTSQLELTAYEGPAPLTVGATFNSNLPAPCISYRIDWGDGKDLKVKRQTHQCQVGEYKDFEIGQHVYSKPGAYKIRFFSTANSSLELEDEAGYIEKQVTVH